MRMRSAVGSVAAAVVLVVGATWALARTEASKPDRQPAPPALAVPSRLAPAQGPLLEARTKGDPKAPVTIFEASDFQCPYCRVFWEQTLPLIEKEYVQTGKVRFIFLNLPLVQIHPNAAAAHEFAMCGAVQQRFWPVHDLLYLHQQDWAGLDDPGPYFRTLADSAGLDRGALESCFATGAVRQLIQQEAEMNLRAGLQSTPSFVIENGLLPGAAPIEMWRPILDSIFAAKTGKP